MTLQNLYNKVRKNKATKQQFLAEARKHATAGALISPLNSFQDVVKILKNRGILSETKKVQSNKNGFNLKEYLREVEDEEAPEEEAPEEEAPEEEMPAEEDALDLIGNMTSRYLKNLKKIEGYGDIENASVYIKQIIDALPQDKQTKLSLLKTVYSKYTS